MLRPLDRDRRCLAAADAERGDAAFQPVTLERRQQRHDQPRSGRADRVAEWASTAIDVERVARDRGGD